MGGEIKTGNLVLSAFILGIVAAALIFVSSWAQRQRAATAAPPENAAATAPQNTGDCVIGGCSKELCTDASEGPAISPCIYSAQFGCYKSAACERQADGTCGWTPTPALRECIQSAQQSNSGSPAVY